MSTPLRLRGHRPRRGARPPEPQIVRTVALDRLSRPPADRRRTGLAVLHLLRCARQDRQATDLEAGWVLAQDPALLGRLLAAHRVGPLVHDVLASTPSLSGLTALTAPLHAAQLRRTLAARPDLDLLCRRLQGLRWTVVKGAAAASLYSRPTTREWHDVDVLVHGEDLPRALEALETGGAAVITPDWRRTADLALGEVGLALPHGTVLDLHWHLLNLAERRHAFRYDVRTVLHRRRTRRVLGLDVPVPHPVDEAHHLAVHATLSGGWRLGWSYDVAQAADRLEDWDGLVALTREAGTGLVVGLALQRARELLGARVPTDVLRDLHRRGRGWSRVGRVVTAWVPPQALEGPDWLSTRCYAGARGTSAHSLRRFLVRARAAVETTPPAVPDLRARQDWFALAAAETQAP
ncbi:nucleotidyltransferase family protein [Kineococcus sp. LSe6-4]|uniref:Nucleotidyltransferase family protein n=1 Tax=Kineococcus halophytocola TaxID=3234027 RepID=A0ABV4H266_9ACTN